MTGIPAGNVSVIRGPSVLEGGLIGRVVGDGAEAWVETWDEAAGAWSENANVSPREVAEGRPAPDPEVSASPTDGGTSRGTALPPAV